MSGVVWVLGAGFSKALGGPLLPALLSKQSQSRLLAAYPDLEQFHNSRGTAIVRGLLLDKMVGP
jgi:hypothetical protein